MEQRAVEVPTTPAQAARRQRVIDTAIEMARQGGYDAVQMRDLATKAHVALGTIYRYFSSKDHVLGCAFEDWVVLLERAVERHPPQGATPAEQLADIMGRATAATEQNPLLTAALMTGLGSSDPSVAACRTAVTAATGRLMEAAMGDVSAERRAGVIRVLEHVWFSSLMRTVNAAYDEANVGEELQLAIRLLLGEGAGKGAGARTPARRASRPRPPQKGAGARA